MTPPVVSLRSERALRDLRKMGLPKERAKRLVELLDSRGSYLERFVLVLRSLRSLGSEQARDWLVAHGYGIPTSKRKQTS